MTQREEEIIKEANEYCNGNKGSDARVRTAFLIGANYADEHPSQENIKNELIKLGYGFDLNGNIISKEQENEMLKRYCEHQKEKLIEKAYDWLKDNIYNRVYECGDKLGFPTAEFLNQFKEYMED